MTFKKKVHEKQYCFDETMKDKIQEAQAALNQCTPCSAGEQEAHVQSGASCRAEAAAKGQKVKKGPNARAGFVRIPVRGNSEYGVSKSSRCTSCLSTDNRSSCFC